ncbi:MAG TPA: hypothetical protein PLH48_05740 [Acinetobacter johnsonii]|nr:hypothetical protein [Acinetobacter johnsonii]
MSQENSPTPMNTQLLNQNVNVLANALEFTSATLVSIQSDLIADKLEGQSLTLQTAREALLARIKYNLKLG